MRLKAAETGENGKLEGATMAINAIQFQKGMSLAEFNQRFGTESQCEEALFDAIWPGGFRCQRCGHGNCNRFTVERRQLVQCSRCHWQRSLKAGTVFQSSNLPLSKWFLALYLLTQAKNNLAALELKRWLGVCYRTAWRVKHKLMQAMQQREQTRRLEGRIEVDDAYLGGERQGGKVGRGSENKVAFVAAVESELDGSVRYARLEPVAGFGNVALTAWAERALVPGAHVVSDGLWAFTTVKQQQCSHEAHKGVEARVAVKRPVLRRVNTLLGNLKTALSGTYHAFKFKKYAARYLAEYQYRFNRRFDLQAMVPRLLVACVAGTPMTENQLRFNDVDRR